MRVLALIMDRPEPPITATRVRNLHLWPAVSRLGVEVRVLGVDAGPSSAEQRAFLGLEAEFFPFERDRLPVRAWGLLAHPYHEYPRSKALAQRVDEVAASWGPDIIHAEDLRMASYLPCMRNGQSRAKQSVTAHNVESDLFERIAYPPVPFGRSLVKRLQVHSLRRYEARAAARTDLKFAFSALDRARYAQLFPKQHWSLTRNGADFSGIHPAPQPVEPKILFVATWVYGPNRTGLAWFLDAVAPHLMPEVKMTAAGSAADDWVRGKLAEHGVRFVDTPLDLKPLYEEHAIAVVPLLEGSGTRSKILEALAYGRLVVTTTKGVEGLDLAEGEGILIADEPEAFARRINEALASPELRASLIERGRAAAQARYDWTVVAAELKAAWEGCLAGC